MLDTYDTISYMVKAVTFQPQNHPGNRLTGSRRYRQGV